MAGIDPQAASSIILLAGPTASGKSALALELADRIGGVIVNADALQVYRDLRVLTARPSAEDERRVPHLLYGHVGAAENYSVGRWLGEAAAVLDEARREGRPAIVVGGTGLYFKALTEGLTSLPPIPPEVRERWRERGATEEPAVLHAALAERDPEGAAAIRASDRTRIVRALEVLEATGAPLREWQKKGSTPVVSADARRFVLEIDRERLAERIGARLDAMVREGALEEVAALAQMKLDPASPIMKAVGVRELLAHVEGGAGLEEALAQTRRATLQYAKRQMTWFRNQMAHWPRIEAGNIWKAIGIVTATNG
jgi:tRNA dimethylallyltransferase